MVFNATFNNIWWSVLLVEETGGPGEKHRPAASHWQTLSHNVEKNKDNHLNYMIQKWWNFLWTIHLYSFVQIPSKNGIIRLSPYLHVHVFVSNF